ncbi:hypothetical protein U9M48_044547 [Paspalum notatum var. saurae]|uniref:Nucleotide-diphospho-sugar transferase domain-containing protein n=1 Tax=Paspalum notatum var. saurae TaxID=547442 RepID=A0AAQ3UXB9_PASNO
MLPPPVRRGARHAAPLAQPHRRREGRRPRGGNGIAGLAGCLLPLLLLLAIVAAAAVLWLPSPPSRRQHEEGGRGGGATPRVTIFAAPRPPPEGSPARKDLAVRSWLALPGNVSVVLLGAGPGDAALAARLGRRVTIDAAIDSAFTGTPFFHSMVARAQAAAESDICVLVDAEIILLPEIVSVLAYFSKVDRDWFFVAMARNVTDFHYQLADNGSHWVQADGKEVSFNKEIPADNWALESSDRGLIIAWNNPGSPLHAGVLPSFLLILGLYPESFSSMHNISLTPDLPYSLSMLLELAADMNRSVVLGVAGASYRDLLMSWACRLRHLRVTNFIVCALDHETYEFSVLQGLPVFRVPSSPKNASFDDCHFGTKCFQHVTKAKSRIVLEILKMGYNVLLSDVDIYWFDNPMPFLYSLGPATFGAQSDEYDEIGPINLPRRLNSGFYFARSDNATITAMEMIVEHASNSGLSEQPSFYDVLCGKNGTNCIGDDKCLEPNTNLTVVFLNRDLFPNGAYKGLWEKHDVRSTCKELGCFIIHNNWINKRKKKLHRQMSSGLWDYDPSCRQCLQEWSDRSSFRMMGRFHLFEDIDS